MRPIRQLFLILFSAGALCAGDTTQATDRATGVFLHQQDDGWRLERSGAEPLVLSLPAGFRPFAVEALSDGWVVTGTAPAGRGRDLVIVRGEGRRAEVLPNPPQGTGQMPGNPAIFVERGRFAGLAWAEGDRQDTLTVHSAEWHGGTWSVATEVSGRGPGAQLALSGTVLANGDWLLLWSAFDGEDDEILWSRRSDGGWSRPARLHADNQVPDITPTVIATDRGALAAWSVFDDSDYRLRIGWLDGDDWTLTAPSGGKGSLYPQALSSDSRLMILHRTVIPDGWTLLEFETDGTLVRNGLVEMQTAQRPLLVPSANDGFDLWWPGGATDTAGPHAVRWEESR